MDVTLSDRQRLLLKAIISEFMDTAEAVGSLNLPEKYELGVSPATIRNEMAKMAQMGLIMKEHSSAGRVPTPVGYKFFINEILGQLEELNVKKEVLMREEVYRNRFDAEGLFRSSVRKLAELLGGVGVAMFKNRVYFSGVSDIMDIPEFQDPRVFKQLMKLLENSDKVAKVFGSYGTARGADHNNVKILIGEQDLGYGPLGKVALAFGKLDMYGGNTGYLGIMSTCRMNYSKVIPVVKLMVNTVNESLKGW